MRRGATRRRGKRDRRAVKLRRALAALSLCALGAAAAVARAGTATPVHGYEVAGVRPHDPAAFTQGLAYADGILYESTGRYGESSLRAFDLAHGALVRRIAIPERYFAEGIALLDGKIFLLTWRSGRGFVYDAGRFERVGEFRYEGEGWGLTTDGDALIMSDGTSVLRFLDPATFRVRRKLEVRENGEAVEHLNELEWVKGEIYANVWRREAIARIEPETGRVRAWIDLAGLHTARDADAVLNGIAYDAEGDRLFVTGKLWPRLFEIRLTGESSR